MSTSPFRILLVDDSAPFRRQVSAALEASGLIVVEATEGVEALWRARAEGIFDLVLLDIHMPNMDGLTFIREVRKLPGYSRIPIVVVTSDGSRERRLEGRAAGATAWLLKPPDLPGLINAVHSGLMGVRERDTQKPRSGALATASIEPPPRRARRVHPATQDLALPPIHAGIPAVLFFPRARPPLAAPEQRPSASQRAPGETQPPLRRPAVAAHGQGRERGLSHRTSVVLGSSDAQG